MLDCNNGNGTVLCTKWTSLRVCFQTLTFSKLCLSLQAPFGVIKTLYTIGNCQRPVFSLGVSQHKA